MSIVVEKKPGQITALKGDAFDGTDIRTMPVEQRKAAEVLGQKMLKAGFDLVGLHKRAAEAQRNNLPRTEVDPSGK